MRWMCLLLCPLLCLGCDDNQSGKSNSAVKSDSGSTKKEVVDTSQKSFESVDEALQVLAQAVADHDSRQQKAVYSWLREQGSAIGPDLIKAIENPKGDLTARRVAMRSLTGHGPEAGPKLIEWTSSDEPPIQLMAIELLGQIESPTSEMLDRLLELLADADPKVQRTAIKAIAAIGPPAERAADTLKTLRTDSEHEFVRVEAGRALRKVKPVASFRD